MFDRERRIDRDHFRFRVDQPVVQTAKKVSKPAGLQNSHGMPVAQPHASAIHHDSVPDNLKETWQYEGKNYSYSDRFSGYAIFVSNDNADRAASLAFGHSLGQELQKHGLHYTPHYTLPLMGRYRHELIDEEAGVYRRGQSAVSVLCPDFSVDVAKVFDSARVK